MAYALSLGLALFGGLIISLRFCDQWALVFLFLVYNHDVIRALGHFGAYPHVLLFLYVMLP